MSDNKKFYEIIKESNKNYSNDPELIKLLLEYKGQEGHKKIQNKLFKKLINQYVFLDKELKNKLNEITELSETDPLTKIFNRIKFVKELNNEIKRLSRFDENLSIIMFDIDHFKKINDNFGHDIGDSVLIELTKLVKKSIREIDVFTRWGGEEFMILLPNTNLENAMILAEKLRYRIESYNFFKVNKVTCSFGVTEFIKKIDEMDLFTKRVDNALYKAKDTGRNRIISL